MKNDYNSNVINICFSGNIPSKKNSKQIVRRNNGGLFLISSKDHLTWHRDNILKLNKYRNLKIEKCSIEYNFYSENKRTFDLSNKIESINDLFVDLQIITDDNYNVINSITARYLGINKDISCEVKIIRL